MSMKDALPVQNNKAAVTMYHNVTLDTFCITFIYNLNARFSQMFHDWEHKNEQ